MTVIDIACPVCERAEPVRKVGIGAYRCTACDHTFDHESLDPVAQSDERARR